MRQLNPDPLYNIFEQQLLNDQDQIHDTRKFIDTVVQTYLKKLNQLGLLVPQEWRAQVEEELASQVQAMLLKKTYGHFSLEEFRMSLEQDPKYPSHKGPPIRKAN